MKTTNTQIGDTVYIDSIGSLKKCTVTDIYSSAISCQDDDGHHNMVYNWYMSLDDAVKYFVDHINEKFETSYKLEKDETMTSSETQALCDAVDAPDFVYAWTITGDHINGGEYLNTSSKSFEKGMELPLMFRLCDDDGEVYYTGYTNDRWTERAFSPLDDFGMPNDGCTEIQFLVDDKWETL